MVASSPTSGSYDHPSYLTRQQIEVVSVVGASGTGGYKAFVSDMRLRKVTAVVRVAGTSTGAGNSANLMCIGTYITGFGTGAGTALTTNTGTNTLVTFALGTTVSGSFFGTSTDMNLRLNAGAVLAVKAGTDATGQASLTVEAYLDPEASWTGPG